MYVSSGALERLSADALAAVVEHEAHHAARRDPLRILVARAIGEAYSLTALPRREQALAELAADAAAVRRRGAAPLAAALLAFDATEIAPERVDRLTGAPPSGQVPRALVAGAGVVIVALRGADRVPAPGLLPAAGLRARVALCALTARLVAMGPAWLGWRRAGAFLNPGARVSAPCLAGLAVRGDLDRLRLPLKRETITVSLPGPHLTVAVPLAVIA